MRTEGGHAGRSEVDRCQHFAGAPQVERHGVVGVIGGAWHAGRLGYQNGQQFRVAREGKRYLLLVLGCDVDADGLAASRWHDFINDDVALWSHLERGQQLAGRNQGNAPRSAY